MPRPSPRFLAALAAAPPHRMAGRPAPSVPAADEFGLTIPGVPCPWARAGHHGRVTFTPHRQRAWMESARVLMRAALFKHGHRGPLSGPVLLTVRAFWPRPASRPVGHACARPIRPDADNVGKIVMDAGNDVLWKDDAQIVVLHVEKWVTSSDDEPRVEITVERGAEA